MKKYAWVEPTVPTMGAFFNTVQEVLDDLYRTAVNKWGQEAYELEDCYIVAVTHKIVPDGNPLKAEEVAA